MSNLTVRNRAKEKGVKLWEVAEALKVNEFAFSRSLRHEFPEEKTQKIIGIIDAIASERAS